MSKSTASNHDLVIRRLTIALAIALAVGAWLLKGYFSLIVVAVILSYLFRPVYLRIRKKTKRDSSAAALTLIISILVIAIPILLILVVTAIQAGAIISHVSSTFSAKTLNDVSTEMINAVNDVLTRLTGGNVTITSQEVLTQLSKLVADVAGFMLNAIKGWLGGIGSVISGAILYMYIFTGVTVYQEQLISLMARLNPLGPDVTKLYLERTGSMTKAMVRGQFIIAAIQGLESATVLHMVGIPYFAFFLMLLTFLSIIPLGAGIVTIPMGIISILFGNYTQGIIILLNHFVIVTNIDNVLKPKLVPKEVRLHPALLLLSIFAGIGAFGFLGIIIGPVIMILISTTIQIYLQVTTTPPKLATPRTD